MHSVVYCEYTAKVGDSIMKSLYDAARHLVWLTQFGLSVVIPPVVCIIGAVWLRRQLQQLADLGALQQVHSTCKLYHVLFLLKFC